MTCATSAAKAAAERSLPPERIVSVVPLLAPWRLDRSFDYRVAPGAADVAVGALVRVPFGGRNVRAVVVERRRGRPERDLQEVAKVLLDEPVVAPPLDELARWLAIRCAVPLGKALDRFTPPRVRIARRDPIRLTGGPRPRLLLEYERGPELLTAIEDGRSGAWCVNALPSHPRSELIAELIAAAGRAEGSALVAVPEVRFGSEVLDGLARVWPSLARVDSSQQDRDRAEAWLQMARGHGLAGGGRSTVFTPAPALRLIVIDAEHDRTFKEDRSPRYDARVVAVERARLQGAVCVLVSEAPRVETAGAAMRGEAGWVEPPSAARRSARPLVETVPPPRDGEISSAVFARMRAALRDDADVAVLVPRRGYARVVWCAACRRSLRCPRCETAVVLDRSEGRIRCPRCSWATVPPEVCPSCGAADFRFLGAGNERLAEQLARAFPRARVSRMDPAAIGSAGPELGPTDIYVTTWIGTKPEIRPSARLVAVLDADGLLRRPDLRAAELGFQALSAMSRWAGPAAGGGRLVIQTSEPGHHAIQAIARADPRYFLEREIELRRQLMYPPFAHLVKISGPQDQVERAAAIARGRGVALGPVPLGDGESELLVKVADPQALLMSLRPLLASAEAGALRVDPDPR